jgi:hypothetical protein
MSKSAKSRRFKKRTKYLVGLAVKNPEKFKLEWNKRLESWAAEANTQARCLQMHASGSPSLSLQYVDKALTELDLCTQRIEKEKLPTNVVNVVTSEIQPSAQTLAAECEKALANVFDQNLQPKGTIPNLTESLKVG